MMPPANAVNNWGQDIIIATFSAISLFVNRLTTIELALKRKINFTKLATITPSQKFFARKKPKIKIKRALDNIIKGIIGASIGDKSPADKATTLGIKPTKIAFCVPKRITEIKSIALTMGPVIAC